MCKAKKKVSELKVETEKFSVIVGEFNTLCSITERVSRQPTTKDIKYFNNL